MSDVTHEDINAAIAYGRAVAKRYIGWNDGCLEIHVGPSGRAFIAYPMRGIAAARGLTDGAWCLVRVRDGVTMAQIDASASGED